MGEVKGFGEINKVRNFMSLICKKDQKIIKGMNKSISIGTTISGKLRISESLDNTLYLILSSKGGYTKEGNGTIQVLNSKKGQFEILARGNGADGDADSIGFWDCILMKAPSTGAIVKVRTSGNETPTDLYVINKSKVHHCTISELGACCESLGIEIPCEITDNGKFKGYEWVTL